MRIASKKQYTAEYWDAHRGIAGASDAEHVATPVDGKYPASSKTLIAQLIADTYDPCYGMYDDGGTRSMRNGLWSEPQAKAAIEFELSCQIQEVGFCIAEIPVSPGVVARFGCSPDGFIGDGGGIECKVPDHKTHVKYLLAGTLPTEYRPQVHWSLIVTGRKWWKWVSWNPYLPPVIVHVEPDDYTKKVAENMGRFWSDYQNALYTIEQKFPPPPPPTVYDGGPVIGSVEVPATEVVPYF